MNAPAECRRCVECEGQAHHWSREYMGSFDPHSGEPLAEFACKHCGAHGDPCPECGADPEFDEEPRNPHCLACGGVGIVVVTFTDIDEDEQ